MSNISPLAHVDPDARIGNDVTIHPFAFISKNTVIGDGSTIYPYVSVLNGARIGCRTKIYNGAIIAAEPQDFRWKGEPSLCYIGDDCIVREHTIINRGLTGEGGTRVGNKCFVMAESHIMHDAVVEDWCVVGNGAQLSPYAHVNSYTILAGNTLIHPHSDIGSWAMIKGGCRISGNVPPFTVMAHNPVAYCGVNAMIMRHSKLFGERDEQVIDDIARCYRHIYESGTSVFNALKRIELDVPQSDERDAIVGFIRSHDMNIVALPARNDILD